MRQIALDTETTGLNIHSGNRIIEIGCIEIINRRLTGNKIHFYINPDRDSESNALAVHGLTTKFLKSQPRFSEIAKNLLNFILDSQVIIHNAPFDISFLNAELSLIGMLPFQKYCIKVIDTLAEAKKIFPGKRNSLNALCERFGIDNTARKFHGALLDSKLLAEVYLSMTRKQEKILFKDTFREKNKNKSFFYKNILKLPIIAASNNEEELHKKILNEINNIHFNKN